MTRRVAALLLVAAAAMFRAEFGRAEVAPIARSGAWTSFGGRTDDDKPVCGVLTTGSAGRVLGVKWLVGDDHLTVVLRKQAWRIPDHADAEVLLEFDRAGPWRARAHGTGQNLEFYIPLNAVDEFERQFRTAHAVRVSFPSGTESPWIGTMGGSSGAITSMIRCMAAANQTGGERAARRPALPFGQSGVQPREPLPEARGEPASGDVARGDAPLPKSAVPPSLSPAAKSAPAQPTAGKAKELSGGHASFDDESLPQDDASE